MGEAQYRKHCRQLRAISPTLYRSIIKEFEKYHIHSYDIVLEGKEKGSEVEVTLRYGESFAQKKKQSFPLKKAEHERKDVIQFAKTAAKKCKEVMIADYFNKMSP